jgi:hypothetical protein
MSTDGETFQFPVLPYRCRWLLFALSVLVVAQPGSEVQEGLMNHPFLTPKNLNG